MRSIVKPNFLKHNNLIFTVYAPTFLKFNSDGAHDW